MKYLKSGIPQRAQEQQTREQKEKATLHGDRLVHCFFQDKIVGQRLYNHEDLLVLETPMKDGLKHGREITWRDDGTLLLIEPYVDGKVHGTAKQYGQNGNLIGTYKMVHGTGLDVWRQEEEDNTVFVSEIHYLEDGLPSGYEWSFGSPKQDLWHERHWKMGKLHGIERIWNRKGRLRPGYPKFYIADQLVSRQTYINMTETDKTLPVFRESDNLPYRKLPLKIKRLMSE